MNRFAPTFTAEEVTAIVDEAHKKGHKVSCHAFGGEGLHNCINAGVESIEHGVDLDDGEIKQMIQKGIYLVPTLYHYQLDREHDMKKYDGHSVAEVSERSFPKAVAAGVKIAFGSGAGPFPHGTQMKEFEYMTKFGMTPVQAIRAATSEAAQLMGWQDRVGSIDAGKDADLVIHDAQYTEEEYRRFGEPYDRRILEAVQRRSKLTILHAHGEHLMFDRLATLPAHAWNWDDRRAGPDDLGQDHPGERLGVLLRELLGLLRQLDIETHRRGGRHQRGELEGDSTEDLEAHPVHAGR